MIDERAKALRKRFDETATTFQEASLIYSVSAESLIARLEPFKTAPNNILELGSACGQFSQLLKSKYPTAELIALDSSLDRLKLASSDNTVCADAYQLPFGFQSFDMVVSHLMLHWILDLPRLLAEIKRVLKPQGVFVFSYYGPDTLREMGEPWSPFIDMHDVGDALVQAGFRDPILDVERFNIEYDGWDDAQEDLLNTADNELINLSKPHELQLITYEMVYGHAWLESHTFSANQEGVVSIPLHCLQKRK